MRLETIEEFVIFSRHLNMSKAAQEANVSQPSFSEHMASLEKSVGATLIDRSGGKLALTPAGEEFLKHAQTVLSKYREGVTCAQKAQKDTVPVRICSNFPIDARILSFLRKKGANIKVTEIGFNASPIEFVGKGNADLGIAIDLTKSERFLREMQQTGIGSFTVSEGSTLALSMSRTNPLASKERISKEDLRGAVLLSNIGYLYDAYKANIMDALGSDFPVEIRLEPITSLSDLAFSEIGDGIHICGKGTFDRYQSDRDDIVVFEKVEGVDFLMPMTCLYRINESNADVLSVMDALKEFE